MFALSSDKWRTASEVHSSYSKIKNNSLTMERVQEFYLSMATKEMGISMRTFEKVLDISAIVEDNCDRYTHNLY